MSKQNLHGLQVQILTYHFFLKLLKCKTDITNFGKLRQQKTSTITEKHVFADFFLKPCDNNFRFIFRNLYVYRPFPNYFFLQAGGANGYHIVGVLRAASGKSEVQSVAYFGIIFKKYYIFHRGKICAHVFNWKMCASHAISKQQLLIEILFPIFLYERFNMELNCRQGDIGNMASEKWELLGSGWFEMGGGVRCISEIGQLITKI